MEKKQTWPRILFATLALIALVIIVILAMSSCDGRNEVSKLKAELGEKQKLIDQLQNTKPPVTTSPTTTPTTTSPEPEVHITVVALNATIEGSTTAVSDGKTALTADAVLAEGQSVDHWEINGVAQENSANATFSFTATETTVVKAVISEEKKLTTVNCSIRFLDAKGKAAGDKLTEFVFGDPYTNPVTKAEVTDGTISFQVKAEVPSDKVIDYWKINGVEYHITNSSMIVEGLDESTEYEVVLKEKPVVYYTVTCLRCNSGGKTEIKVKAGDSITITGNSGKLGWWYIDDSQSINDAPAASWTFKIDKNCTIEFWEVIY